MTKIRLVNFLIAACTLTTLLTTPSYATTKLTTVIQVDQVGGFVGPNFKSAQLPIVVAYSDGRVFSQKTTAGSVKEMYQGQASYSILKTQISAFTNAMKEPVGGWGMPGVADVPSTVVSVAINGVKHTSNIYALGFTSKEMSATAIAARVRLTKTIAALIKIAGTKSIYKPVKFEVWPQYVDTKKTGLGMANPAAVFCISQNGTLVPVSQMPTPPTPAQNASVVFCHLSDGSYIEEWAYFYKASKAGIVWPANVQTPASSCTVVMAKPFLSLLKASGNKQWLLPSGAMTPITWRPILPLEVGCKR